MFRRRLFSLGLSTFAIMSILTGCRGLAPVQKTFKDVLPESVVFDNIGGANTKLIFNSDFDKNYK